jgi:integrase
VEDFHKLLEQLEEPFRMMALMCLCFSLRISECLALKWSDVDWLNGKLCIERGIVHQVVDDVKTPESERLMDIDKELLDVLRTWKQLTQFPESADWVFASPVQIGRLPFSYSGIWRVLRKASVAAGIGHVTSHSFRHTFRSWLDAEGTPLGVQRRLMRHRDIRTTMLYGRSSDQAMREAHSKVVKLAFTGAN